jgi:hypothetical protein
MVNDTIQDIHHPISSAGKHPPKQQFRSERKANSTFSKYHGQPPRPQHNIMKFKPMSESDIKSQNPKGNQPKHNF